MKRFKRSLKRAGRSAASFQDITWSSKLNEPALPYSSHLHHATGFHNQAVTDGALAHTWITPDASLPHYDFRRHSQTSLAESGIASNSPSMMSTLENHRSATWRAPTTPHAIRQKPPPKPPRLQSVNSASHSSPCSPVEACSPAPYSPGAYSCKSSFGDITGTLDSSFSSHPGPLSEVQPISRVYPMGAEDKVYHILLQTKEFLVNELDAESLLMPLQDKGVLDPRAVSQLLRSTNKPAMTDLLLDMLTTTSHRHFLYFCDTLRHHGKCPHLADMLLALDRLVDLGSEDAIKRRQTHGESIAENSCPMCSCQNDFGDMAVDDFLMDTTNFDVEIMYIDKETGQVRPQKEVAALKMDKLLSAGKVHKVPEELVKHEADRYVPVITCGLYNYCLWDVGMEKIARALSRNSCIRELSLSKCHLGLPSIQRLSQSVQQSTGLHKVDLRLNTLSHECLAEFAEGLKKNTSVKVINLSSTGLNCEGCHILLQGICRNQSTSDLDIGFNDLTNSGCEVIAQAVATNCPLRRLRIRDNGISFDGAFRLFKALKKNSRLTFLDISSNNIGNRSMATLSEILRYNRTLKQLNLENCCISKDGSETLARALKTNTVLRVLNLSMNPIGDQGVDGLAQGLKYNQVLDTLCLNMCDITNLGFAQLLDSLQFNMSLKTLKLCYNRICRLCDECSSLCDFNQNLAAIDANSTNGESETQDKVNGNHNNGENRGLNAIVPSIEEVYEKLCQILQQNKDLKVLLWGNKLDEDGIGCPGDLHSRSECGDTLGCVNVSGDRRSAISEPADLQSSLSRYMPHSRHQFAEHTLAPDMILREPNDRDVLDLLSDNSTVTSCSAPTQLNQMQREFAQQYTIQGVQGDQNGSTPCVLQNGYRTLPANTGPSQAGLLSLVIPNSNHGINYTAHRNHMTPVRPQISPRMGTTAPSMFNGTNGKTEVTNGMSHHQKLSTETCASSEISLHHPRIRTNGSLPRRAKTKYGVKGVMRNGDLPHVAQCLPEEEEGEGEFKPHTFPRRVPHTTTLV